MKLDGDKLLADLESKLEHIDRLKLDRIKQELWVNAIKLQASFGSKNEIYRSIKDENYTTKDDNQ